MNIRARQDAAQWPIRLRARTIAIMGAILAIGASLAPSAHAVTCAAQYLDSGFAGSADSYFEVQLFTDNTNDYLVIGQGQGQGIGATYITSHAAGSTIQFPSGTFLTQIASQGTPLTAGGTPLAGG